MARFKRILKTTAKIVVAVVLLLLVANGLLNFYWSRQIEARLAAIRAAGEPASLADMQKQPVPEQDNAAPIYDRAFEAMTEPAANQDMMAICNILSTEPREPSDSDWARAKPAMARFGGVLALIEEAQSKPACEFPMYPVMKGMSSKSIERHQALESDRFDRLARLRDATRLLSAKAILCAREGKTSDVVRYTESALRLTDAIRKNAMLVDCLVDISIVKMTLSHMRQALSYCQPSEDELRQLDRTISRIDVPGLYKQAIEGERVHFIEQNAEYGKSGMPMWRGDSLAYLTFLSRHLESTGMDYSTALSKGLVGGNAADSVPFYATLTKIMAPVIARGAGARYKCEADIACARTFLALRAYKARLGKYPQTLRELSSGVRWDLPKDPFTGKDLVYKRIGSGFIVYSVAYDLKDNGGAPLSHGEAEQSGDIVWRVVR